MLFLFLEEVPTVREPVAGLLRPGAPRGWLGLEPALGGLALVLSSWAPGGGARACLQLQWSQPGELGVTSPRLWAGFLLASELPTVTKNDA